MGTSEFDILITIITVDLAWKNPKFLHVYYPESQKLFMWLSAIIMAHAVCL